MFKKMWGILISVLLSVSCAVTAMAAGELSDQSTLQDVEGAVEVIRGMYGQTNSGDYDRMDNQWIRQGAYGDNVVKAVTSNGDPLLDPTMRENGYEDYSVEYYYDNEDYSQQYVSGTEGPNFVFAVIDGREYRYYFMGNFLIRRIGPDGIVSENPRPNSFIKRLYLVGCRYQNNLSICSNRSFNRETIHFADRFYDMGDHLELYAYVSGGGEQSGHYGLFTVDAGTAVGPDIHDEIAWKDGDNGYTWLNRYLHTESGDYGYVPLECFLVNTTGGHVDVVEGIYATH